MAKRFSKTPIIKKKTTLSAFMEGLSQQFNDVTVRMFHFNPIMVNTLVLHDSTGEAIIVDPGNCQSYEDDQLKEYITHHQLTVKSIVNTHPHIDHIAGNPWCVETWPKARLLMHEAGQSIYNLAYAYAVAFGLNVESMPAATGFLKEGDTCTFGNQKLEVLYTPGHCDGSITLYDRNNGYLICGDLLFEESVGRSDLPTGNGDLLVEMVQKKIFTLPNETIIIPGHGPMTSVEHEKKYNPYIQ
ncbi:MAG: MBL fold metallo-hydrolase [Bacteroidales bacterium]|nr:MBL fold metallo-hydrolase [Bacteroidales bacterium]